MKILSNCCYPIKWVSFQKIIFSKNFWEKDIKPEKVLSNNSLTHENYFDNSLPNLEEIKNALSAGRVSFSDTFFSVLLGLSLGENKNE